MYEIPIDPRQLYEGCILAAIAHAVSVGLYPELDYEHSWDNMTYCTNDSAGSRVAITFHPDGIVGVFQCADSDSPADALRLFDGAPNAILEIAQSEALQYVLSDIEGVATPVITAAFYGTWEQLFSTQSMYELMDCGGNMIRTQLLPSQDALPVWQEYYDLDASQIELIHRLFRQKMNAQENSVVLLHDDMKALYGDTEECLVSLKELNITVSK